jgi:starch phosphorylase
MIRKSQYKVAYLTMEVALENRLRNYAGGLGVLAGDILRSAADLSLPMVGVSLLSDKGYFNQEIIDGKQMAISDTDYDFSRLTKVPQTVIVRIGNENVTIGAWEYLLHGIGGAVVPFYFLDSDFPENSPTNRLIADRLYGGDDDYRFRQEMVLGIGSVKLLKALGYSGLDKFHLNEGHSSLAAAHIFSDYLASGMDQKRALKNTKDKVVFTNHTPVRAGNDAFGWDMVKKYYSDYCNIESFSHSEVLDMNDLGMGLSGFVGGVSRSHSRILRQMHPGSKITYINNGVDPNYWTSGSMSLVFDKYVPGWRQDNSKLSRATRIPLEVISQAHAQSKQELIDLIAARTGVKFFSSQMIIGFARRFASYKRPQLIFHDIDRLLAISDRYPVQLVFAGKAHPKDEIGQEIMSKILKIISANTEKLRAVFLEDYDLDLARVIISGSDVWLNNPLPPLEASGTSGMKAAVNGVPQISTYDGWWVDGYKKGKTGWIFGSKGCGPEYSQGDYENLLEQDSRDFYRVLEGDVLPLYYNINPDKWLKICRSCVAFNGNKFSSQKTVSAYRHRAYGL